MDGDKLLYADGNHFSVEDSHFFTRNVLIKNKFVGAIKPLQALGLFEIR